MSKPRPEPHVGSDADFPTRTLRPGETFEDVMSTNPQEPRPVQVLALEVTDDNSFKFRNGLMMTWNGVIIDTGGNDDDCTKWLIQEPHRRLDGSIHYADGWRRENNGTFVAQSGLVIGPDLSLQHKNGYTVYNDGVTISPSGQQSQGPANSVGIIYRIGVGTEPGLQFQPIRQPSISAEAAASIHQVNFHGRKSMNHVSRGVCKKLMLSQSAQSYQQRIAVTRPGASQRDEVVVVVLPQVLETVAKAHTCHRTVVSCRSHPPTCARQCSISTRSELSSRTSTATRCWIAV
jgi:hypothetical protein